VVRPRPAGALAHYSPPNDYGSSLERSGGGHPVYGDVWRGLRR
jgi:hypothetical protein